VVGLGKIGLPLAAQFAAKGMRVIGCDVLPAVIDAINSGHSHVREEAGLEEAVASAVADGVAGPESIDTAMRLGANYPAGPLEWGERIGLREVVETLDRLGAQAPDGRYRVVPLLRSLAERGGSFFAPRA